MHGRAPHVGDIRHAGAVERVAVGPSGRVVGSGESLWGSTRFWDADTLDARGQLPGRLLGFATGRDEAFVAGDKGFAAWYVSGPEPTGVVAVLAPSESGLLGLVSVLAPVIATGNTAVVVASEAAPLAAITLAEVLATSDVPGGVVNILTGRLAELAPVLAAHMDVNAIDLCGADGSSTELEELAADNVKRIVRGRADVQSPWEIASFLELKTVWHPIGQ